MYHVYLLRSMPNPNQTYIGSTGDLRKRLAEHNAGKSTHTNKFKPWGPGDIRRATRKTSRGAIRKIPEEWVRAGVREETLRGAKLPETALVEFTPRLHHFSSHKTKVRSPNGDCLSQIVPCTKCAQPLR
jgi:hypothetical protein